MAKTSGELFEESQAAFAKAKADREKGMADAGDDESRQAEVTEAYNRALGDATELAELFTAQRDTEEKEASHARAAQISEREKLLESLSKPATQRQLEATAPESKRSSSYQAPGWQRDMPAMMQSSDVLKRSGTDAADEAEAQLHALDMWMASESMSEFEGRYGDGAARALTDIRAPAFDQKSNVVHGSLPGFMRAVTDAHVPFQDNDGGYYIPDQVIPEVTSAEVPRALNLLQAVTRVPSSVGEGHIATMNDAVVTAVDLNAAAAPANNLGDDVGQVAFSARRYFSQQIADNVMMRGPGYPRTIRDVLLYAGRHQICVEIADGQAASFTGTASITASTSDWASNVTLVNLLTTIGELPARWRDFPGGGRGWIMTQPTFYSDILNLEITANKGSIINVADERINGAPVFFTPTQTAAGRYNDHQSASKNDLVATYGNMRHYYVIEVNRPTISRRPAVNHEEYATRFRMHYGAAGVIGKTAAFVNKQHV
ncbi:MAG: hypothetical protein OXQ29_11910 [Rhodospirillaceae bacterium]|nr:hypothetical protein [Rhodospirillaceae bacterium]